MRMTVLSSLRSAGGLLRALRQRVDQLTAMVERQRRTQAQVEAFSANVAHELRTPLATLITGTEFTMRDASLPPEARDRLGTHLEELRRMQGIVGDMLFLSRAYGGHRARRQRVDSLAALAAGGRGVPRRRHRGGGLVAARRGRGGRRLRRRAAQARCPT